MKKLMANLVFRALSVGNKPANMSFIYGSLNLSASFVSPSASLSSCVRILMKIREEEVVSCSLSLMYSKHVQGKASVDSRCPKNLATLRNLFVSNL